LDEALAASFKRMIEELPLHKFLGLKISSVGELEASLIIVVGDSTINPAGSLHGGVIYLMADVSSSVAIETSLSSDEHAVTIDTQTSIYRGTTEGEVTFQALVARRTRRLAFINVKITDSEGQLIAESRITKAIVNGVHSSKKSK